MRINILSLLSAVVALSSLFLPWTTILSTWQIGPATQLWSTDFAPFLIKIGGTTFYNGSLKSWDVIEVFPFVDLLPYWGGWIQEAGAPTYLPGVLGVAAVFPYVYSICLAALGSFANGGRSKAGKKALVASAVLSFFSVVLYSCATSLHMSVGEDGVRMVYSNVGLFVAVLGFVLTFVSLLRPKFINVQAGFKEKKFDEFKRRLAFSENGKMKAMFLVSFLVTLMFAIFCFVLPTRVPIEQWGSWAVLLLALLISYPIMRLIVKKNRRERVLSDEA